MIIGFDMTRWNAKMKEHANNEANDNNNGIMEKWRSIKMLFNTLYQRKTFLC